MNQRTLWILALLSAGLPYLALGLFGFFWLAERRSLLLWVSLAALLPAASFLIVRWIRRRRAQAPAERLSVEPDATWSPRDLKAWQEVERIACRPGLGELPLDNPGPAFDLLREVLTAVARVYHPKAREPSWEVPIPDALRIVELVSADLRRALAGNVPGAHILTFGDLKRIHNLSRWWPWLSRAYRAAMLVLNPATVIQRELQTFAQGQLVAASTEETKAWAVRFAVQKSGWYAIQLYSGRASLLEEAAGYVSAASRADTREAAAHDEARASEPFRLLVVGQVKAGKSSLINALFAEARAVADPVLQSAGVQPHLLEIDEFPRALILDTAGYGAQGTSPEAWRAVRRELAASDMVFLVCSALSASRGADRRLLDEIRAAAAADPERSMPPVLVVLSHVDGLRPFREWEPPYDIAQPKTEKARQIRAAVESVAADLGVPPADVVPVCLAAGKVDNVDEALIPAMLERLDAADRARCLRSLQGMRAERKWDQLWEQSRSAGRILVEQGRRWIRGE